MASLQNLEIMILLRDNAYSLLVTAGSVGAFPHVCPEVLLHDSRKEAALQELEIRAAGLEKAGRRSMADINKRNAAQNFDNALKNVSARPGQPKAQEGDDIFARRSTRPMTYWSTRRAGPRAGVL